MDRAVATPKTATEDGYPRVRVGCTQMAIDFVRPFADYICVAVCTDAFRGGGVRQTAELFKALADETRLRILHLLVQGELCVCDIMTVLGIGQSKASRHLAYLRSARLVDDRRDGVWMYYALAKPKGLTHRRIAEWLGEAAASIPQAAADRKALQTLQRRARLCSKCANSNGNGKSPAPRSGARPRRTDKTDDLLARRKTHAWQNS
jgi:ArsR family transcriptional regulator